MARVVLTLPVLAMHFCFVLHVSVHPLLLPLYYNGYANSAMLMVVIVFHFVRVCVCILCHVPLCTICMIHVTVPACSPPRPVRVFMCVCPLSLAVKQPSLSPAPVRSQKRPETPSRPRHHSGSGKEPQCAPG